jgi:hypothetical protein
MSALPLKCALMHLGTMIGYVKNVMWISFGSGARWKGP